MEVKLTDRSKERGLVEVKLLDYVDLNNCIAGTVYEKRDKDGVVTECVDPVIIFKTEMKQGDYDHIVRVAKRAGIIIPLPNPKDFRTDYYGISFGGFHRIVRFWGYTSDNLPPSRRWSKEQISLASKEWLPDTIVMAELIEFISSKIQLGYNEVQIRKELVKGKYGDKILVNEG